MSKSTDCSHAVPKACHCLRLGSTVEVEEQRARAAGGALVPADPRIAGSLRSVNAGAVGVAEMSVSCPSCVGEVSAQRYEAEVTGTDWRITVHRTGDPTGDAGFLLQQLQPIVTRLSECARSKEVLADRARLVEIISATYQSLLAYAVGVTGVLLLERLAARQRLVRFGVTFGGEHPIETLILDCSDMLAALKDPCHRSAKRQRRKRIARRPYSALPLFAEPLARDRGQRVLDPTAAIWITVADRDLLEWVQEPYLFATFNDEAGNSHIILAPAPDAAGDITLRQFCLWYGLSRATEYKLGERKRSVSGERRIKEDPDVPGLHERNGEVVVNLEAHVLVLIERRTTRWSRAAAAAAPPVVRQPPAPQNEPVEVSSEVVEAGDPAEVEACSRQITPTEDMLAYLEMIDPANIDRHRRELLPKIEKERRDGEFILLALRMVPA